MEDKEPGKSGIEELITGYAAGLGINRTRLRFKWEKKPLVSEEHRVRLPEYVLALTISLGKKSAVIFFPEGMVQSSATDTCAFVIKYTDHVMAALRKLTLAEK